MGCPHFSQKRTCVCVCVCVCACYLWISVTTVVLALFNVSHSPFGHIEIVFIGTFGMHHSAPSMLTL